MGIDVCKTTLTTALISTSAAPDLYPQPEILKPKPNAVGGEHMAAVLALINIGLSLNPEPYTLNH